MDGDDEKRDADDSEAHVHDAVIGCDGSRREEKCHADGGTRITAGPNVP